MLLFRAACVAALLLILGLQMFCAVVHYGIYMFIFLENTRSGFNLVRGVLSVLNCIISEVS